MIFLNPPPELPAIFLAIAHRRKESAGKLRPRFLAAADAITAAPSDRTRQSAGIRGRTFAGTGKTALRPVCERGLTPSGRAAKEPYERKGK
jgi:hypothetical protein